MIYIFEIGDEEKIIEADENINFYELFEKYKKEWYSGLDWDAEKYNTILKEKGYDTARAFLQTWRDAYDERIRTIGPPAVAFLSNLRFMNIEFKVHHWVHIYLREDQ